MSGPGRQPHNDESGYVIVQMALLLVPLMLFAALATDVGSWYLRAQQAQRTADAAALAGVAHLPNLAMAAQEARAVAGRNGLVDTTPNINDDFEFAAAPQLEVRSQSVSTLDVRVRVEAPSFFGALVTDSIDIERYSVAEHVRNVFLGNPTSGLGTGTISESALGLPNDKMWLAVNAYCEDRQSGDQFLSAFSGPNSRTCGPSPWTYSWGITAVPTFDPDAYTFVFEVQPGAPTTDIDIYEPGAGCSDAGRTGDYTSSPSLIIEVFGPSTTDDHHSFLSSATPFATVQPPINACISNSPNGDGWWPLASDLPNPGPQGGYYYVRVKTRHPGSLDAYPDRPFWTEGLFNNFSLRAVRAGESRLCAYSSADPTCPQVYGLDWMPIYRRMPNLASDFFVAEVGEAYAGETLTIRFFDAAEGIDNLQFVNPDDQAVPFRWRYADTTLGLTTGANSWETDFTPSFSTCSWQGIPGQPCLYTANQWAWDEHFVEIEIDIPPDYDCGGDCWWRIRYTSSTSNHDRSGWSVSVTGDPIRLVE